MKLSPYLNFKGECREALTFYKSVIGGEIVMMMTYGETPAAEHTDASLSDKIIHGRLVAGDVVIMACDSPPQMYQPAGGISLTLQLESAEEAERVFAGLSAGGTVTMPMEETFFAVKFGMLRDKFGMPWMVICEKQM